MQDTFNRLTTFAINNRYVFWPIVGAIIMIIFTVVKLGFSKMFSKGKHPFQVILIAAIIGALAGLFIAWILKIIFH